MVSNWMQIDSSLAGAKAGYIRRKEDWDFQGGQAETEVAQIDKQISAAEIRVAIAEKDLENHERQVERAREVSDYLQGKFTNAELYGWMSGQLSALHHQAFQLAFRMAKSAQSAAERELGLENGSLSHIRYDNWDGEKRGLLAGERLRHQLMLLDDAYMNENRRELEITRHVSLWMLEPAQVIELRDKGSCTISIPEVLFDLDFPGHYRRRIKTVRVTIPCITGPYTSVSATLRLTNSKWRKQPTMGMDEELFNKELGGLDLSLSARHRMTADCSSSTSATKDICHSKGPERSATGFCSFPRRLRRHSTTNPLRTSFSRYNTPRKTVGPHRSRPEAKKSLSNPQ